jgi:3-methyladenine DNA glycosylase AlkD
MKNFIKQVENEFKRVANPKIAMGQKAYLRNQFDCYGLTSPVRREVQKPFLVKEFLPSKHDLKAIVEILWNKPQREYLYFSQELVYKYRKEFEKEDIKLFEFMVLNQSWWDTIDFIAPKLMGDYFKMYPNQREKYVEKWLDSQNIWLQRSAILFQLKYKQDLDTEFLTYVINALLGSDEFFINKAIGWILREHGKANPDWVLDFANKTTLSKLSRREALRIILK